MDSDIGGEKKNNIRVYEDMNLWQIFDTRKKIEYCKRVFNSSL
jgi:hypothetical protein